MVGALPIRIWDRPRARTATRLGAAAVVAVASLLGPAAPAAAATPLVGTFALAAGSCSGGVSGSYIRMILPSGGVAGPYMSNSDSTCRDQTYTLLRPGSDGGLVTGSYQSPPSPAFDSAGNARARRITAPADFYGTSFATGTSPRDPQTGAAVPAPRIAVSGGRLSGDLRAFAVTWNNQNFNQGAPKPDGGFPGNTGAVSGSYKASTGTFTLQWTSQVVGGPFDKFTGLWHLTGRLIASHGASSASGSGGTGGGPSATGATAHPGNDDSTQQGGGQIAVGGGPLAANPRAAVHASATKAATAPSGTSATDAAAAQPVSSTTTITRDRWQVSWWLVALALSVAVAGFASLVLINRGLREKPSS